MNSLVPSPQLLWHKEWGAAVRSLQSHLFSRMSQPGSLSLSSHGRCIIMTAPCWTHSSFFYVFPVLKRPKQATVCKCALMSVEEDNLFSWSTNSTYLKRAQGAVSHLCCQNTVGSYLCAIYNISTFPFGTIVPHSHSPVLLLFQVQDFTFSPVLVSARTGLISLQGRGRGQTPLLLNTISCHLQWAGLRDSVSFQDRGKCGMVGKSKLVFCRGFSLQTVSLSYTFCS